MNHPMSAALVVPESVQSAPRQLTDAALMEAVRDGNHRAFEFLVERHKDALVNYLVYNTGSRARAEEIAQETFLRAYKAANRYTEQGRFAGWLFRIAINLARTDARRRSRWLQRADQVRCHLHEVETTTPDLRVRGQQEQDAVRQALARLPALYREAVVLREIEGWTYDAIAQTLQIAVGTAKSRVHRGKALLQRDLSRFWEESTYG